jgi:2,3-bisphosphoglycerate-dependent phosphoglycerate mutase
MNKPTNTQPPPPQTTLLVIRHGETVWNFEERFQGHGDSPLTETGRAQARSLGLRLRDVRFDEMIASDLGRATETASIIAECTGHEFQTDKRLRERNYGVLEGLTIPKIKARYSEVFDRLLANEPEYIVPKGESHQQHYQRNIDFLDAFMAEKAGTTVTLVVHGGVLDSFLRFVSGLPLDHRRCFIINNASLSVFRHGMFYGTPRWVVETWGDVGHLSGNGCRSAIN